LYSKLYFDKWNEYLFLSAKYLMWVQMDHRGSPTSLPLLQLEALGVVFSLEGWRRLAEEPSLFASCSRRSETQQFLDVLPDRHGA